MVSKKEKLTMDYNDNLERMIEQKAKHEAFDGDKYEYHIEFDSKLKTWHMYKIEKGV